MSLIQIEVTQKGGRSVYIVEQVNSTSYIARLWSFTGRKPPLYIRLYKTGKSWTSAYEDEKFIAQLGKLIDGANVEAVGR